MENKNKYFYGVDYKLMCLYCQIKDLNSYYELFNQTHIKFNYDQYYLVLIDYREDEMVLIEVISNEKPVRIYINYKYINFYYFFENLEEQEKKYLDELPF